MWGIEAGLVETGHALDEGAFRQPSNLSTGVAESGPHIVKCVPLSPAADSAGPTALDCFLQADPHGRQVCCFLGRSRCIRRSHRSVTTCLVPQPSIRPHVEQLTVLLCLCRLRHRCAFLSSTRTPFPQSVSSTALTSSLHAPVCCLTSAGRAMQDVPRCQSCTAWRQTMTRAPSRRNTPWAFPLLSTPPPRRPLSKCARRPPGLQPGFPEFGVVNDLRSKGWNVSKNSVPRAGCPGSCLDMMVTVKRNGIRASLGICWERGEETMADVAKRAAKGCREVCGQPCCVAD